MILSLFPKNGEDWTRFKIPQKELNTPAALAIKMVAKNPTKVSSRYTYYEIKGDFLNGKF